MDKKQAWLQLVREKSEHYLNLHDGGFDEKMRARLVDCDYEAQTVTYAFPAQDWQINEKGGIHGGAIALGHPIGCSGARIVVTLLYALAEPEINGKYGLASLCIGGGQGTAIIVERL